MSRHRLGFAVKVLADGGLPSHDTRRWQSRPHLRVSLDRLRAILTYLDRHEIRMYRMASALAPYASHPRLKRFHGQVEECGSVLAEVGAMARALDIRLSFHPGQYTVLNSEDADVQAAAIAEVEVHAAILAAMDLSAEAGVVIHIGSRRGGVGAAADRFIAGFERLSERAAARLVIENDDRSFGLADVLEISRRTGLRVVWDALHHRCHDPEGIGDREALSMARGTWPVGQTPKIHFSSPRLDVGERKRRVGRRVERRPTLPQLRAHADLIDPVAFECLLRATGGDRDLDVMLEAKAKDLALLRLREQLAVRGFPTRDGRIELCAKRSGRPAAGYGRPTSPWV